VSTDNKNGVLCRGLGSVLIWWRDEIADCGWRSLLLHHLFFLRRQTASEVLSNRRWQGVSCGLETNYQLQRAFSVLEAKKHSIPFNSASWMFFWVMKNPRNEKKKKKEKERNYCPFSRPASFKIAFSWGLDIHWPCETNGALKSYSLIFLWPDRLCSAGQ